MIPAPPRLLWTLFYPLSSLVRSFSRNFSNLASFMRSQHINPPFSHRFPPSSTRIRLSFLNVSSPPPPHCWIFPLLHKVFNFIHFTFVFFFASPGLENSNPATPPCQSRTLTWTSTILFVSTHPLHEPQHLSLPSLTISSAWIFGDASSPSSIFAPTARLENHPFPPPPYRLRPSPPLFPSPVLPPRKP